MGSYDVQSGSLRRAVTADNARKAALWAVHCWLESIVPIYDDDRWSHGEKRRSARREARSRLDREVVVRQQGPRQCRVWRFETLELVDQWHELLIILTDLDRRLSAGEPAVVARAA